MYLLFAVGAWFACAGCGGQRAQAIGLSGQPPAVASAAALRFELLPSGSGSGGAGAGGGQGGAGHDGVAGSRSQAGFGSGPGTGNLEFVHIHVAGAVALPGVYRLVAGARACDALALAGGETAQANLAAINLASLLSDGQQLYIPTQVEVKASGSVPWPAGPSPFGPLAAAATNGGAAPPGPLDINSASSKALEDLPGIGPVLAARIVAYRAANGRYGSVDDLLKVSGIGPARLADIRDRIIAR